MALVASMLWRNGARTSYIQCLTTRLYASTSAIVAGGRHQESFVQRELFVNILEANVTKRDAKQFIAICKPAVPTVRKSVEPLLVPLQQEHSDRHDRRPQSLAHVEARTKSPHDSVREAVQHQQQQMHVALVCLKDSEAIDDVVLNGFALTLSQLVKLGMRVVVVMDSNASGNVIEADAVSDVKTLRDTFEKEAERLCQVVARHNMEGAQPVPGAFEWAQSKQAEGSLRSKLIRIAVLNQLLAPLRRGSILVVPSMAYTASGQLLPASSRDVMTGVTQEFSSAKAATTSLAPRIEIERVIIVDKTGPVPRKGSKHGAHILINLKQQFVELKQELSKTDLADEANSIHPSEGAVQSHHLHNLNILYDCLALLPCASSGLILSPAAAANPSLVRTPEDVSVSKEIRQKNILIHNLLTNKPMISPSLPLERLPSQMNKASYANGSASSGATLVKWGMPVRVVPLASTSGWQIPTSVTSSLNLEDISKVDLPRLVHLINDSFRRELDVSDYLARIKDRAAGMIVAGDYEGAAIFTWEMPPGIQDPGRLVPYLDKFAVLQSSQGSNGVADILFKAMVESCLPHGLCWRSKKNNPVNKWYFERSAGSWRIPHSEWTMFWTGKTTLAESQLKDYIGVCETVRQSWLGSARPA